MILFLMKNIFLEVDLLGEFGLIGGIWVIVVLLLYRLFGSGFFL